MQSGGVFIPSSTAEAHLASESPTKVAIACTGGGTHAAFEIGVLTAILEEMEVRKGDENARRIDVIGLSGTSAGALWALMVWYGLARKNGQDGSNASAIRQLERLMDLFAAETASEKAFDRLTSLALKAHEMETPLLGLVLPKLSLNPAGALSR